MPGIEPGPPGWEPGILTTRQHGIRQVVRRIGAWKFSLTASVLFNPPFVVDHRQQRRIKFVNNANSCSCKNYPHCLKSPTMWNEKNGILSTPNGVQRTIAAGNNPLSVIEEKLPVFSLPAALPPIFGNCSPFWRLIPKEMTFLVETIFWSTFQNRRAIWWCSNNTYNFVSVFV